MADSPNLRRPPLPPDMEPAAKYRRICLEESGSERVKSVYDGDGDDDDGDEKEEDKEDDDGGGEEEKEKDDEEDSRDGDSTRNDD